MKIEIMLAKKEEKKQKRNFVDEEERASERARKREGEWEREMEVETARRSVNRTLVEEVQQNLPKIECLKLEAYTSVTSLKYLNTRK